MRKLLTGAISALRIVYSIARAGLNSFGEPTVTYRKGFSACLLGLTMWTAAANAATLNVDSNGMLLGAGGVIVDGQEYKVRLTDGSCNSVFLGCDSNLFAFRTAESATQAAWALLNQVYVDGPAGDFDTGFNIAGCASGPGGCITRIPYALQGLSSYLMATAVNSNTGNDYVVLEGPFTNDNGPYSNLNFAAFAPVPLPAGLPLLLGALGILCIARRRKT